MTGAPSSAYVFSSGENSSVQITVVAKYSRHFSIPLSIRFAAGCGGNYQTAALTPLAPSVTIAPNPITLPLNL